MAKKNPEDVVQKQAQNLSSSLERIRKGVMAVETAPGVKAAAKAAKMRANLLKSIDDGTWARNVAAVTREEWQKSMIEKGINRIPDGINAAHDKLLKFYTHLLDYQESGKSKIASMPDITLEDNINRMVAWTRYMADYKKPS